MQWIPAKPADCVHSLMAAILTALLENSKQSTDLLGQRYVQTEVLGKFVNIRCRI